MVQGRSLRPESDTVTVSPDMKEDTIEQALKPTPKSSTNGTKLLPFLGRTSLKVGEPRFFVNGRKLIRIMKVKHGEDKDGKPVFVIKRRMERMIYKGRKSDEKTIQLLIKNKIPGI